MLPSLDQLSPALISKAAETASMLAHAAPTQRRDLAEQLITAVTVSDSAVSLTLALDSLGVPGTGTLIIPASIGKARAKLSLVVPGAAQRTPDHALVTLVAQARSWFEALASGSVTSLNQIAVRDGVTRGYVSQIIAAAFLAPDLVTAIVEGRQPPALGASQLKAMLPLPTSWPEQRALFAALT